MDLHQLFVFTKVVEHKSFSKAAEDVFLSQSTVSSHIQALEKMLDVKLFDRVGRETIVTPYGERLYKWALKLLLLKDQALLDLKQGMNDFRGVIQIAASSVPGQFLLPKMVKAFREQYPNAIFQITQSSSKTAVEKILNGIGDIGIVGHEYVSDKLHYIPLLKEKLVLITSNEMEIKDPVSIRDMLKYPFIMRNTDSGTNAMIERFLKKNNRTKEDLNIVAYTDSGQSLMQFVMQGIGIAIISEIAAKEYAHRNLLKCHEINEYDDERYFYLVYNVNKTQSILSKLFIEKAAILA
ncbi:selenium metabolism-associated LysR family transcriptional regulator [Neobacillus sp. OS1-32]|jgi:DNA-binding transcriptional LysR family regulator|uniref:LysR family transcriptional regulator n=1 Tax=Neobacillus paridis TaxID=2803862 RepID=A0ABS1TT92_9BACI|nr:MULTISPECIES: selenium metabolism-associated LysR family transcriptional regulator [Neobacillus]MBL4954518.1 LysR family transcriptional regulator [Neobacillus paridis]WML30358.1 selenium metabolism-associated LysR family transcriptional regulator [Neobacillus sp. OS1-32]